MEERLPFVLPPGPGLEGSNGFDWDFLPGEDLVLLEGLLPLSVGSGVFTTDALLMLLLRLCVEVVYSSSPMSQRRDALLDRRLDPGDIILPLSQLIFPR